MTKTASEIASLNFVAHQGDDLLFMNPDIVSDIQKGYTVWTVYLTAGEVYKFENGKPKYGGGLKYADGRADGAKEAYARAAIAPIGNWTWETMTLNGHVVPTDRLDGTKVRLLFPYIHAAGQHPDGTADDEGGLYRMLKDPTFEANPIAGPGNGATFTLGSFVGLLRSIIEEVKPDYIRTQNTLGYLDKLPNNDHVDHVAGAILAAKPDTRNGMTRTERREYLDYIIRAEPDNLDPNQRA